MENTTITECSSHSQTICDNKNATFGEFFTLNALHSATSHDKLDWLTDVLLKGQAHLLSTLHATVSYNHIQ